jgi:serine/threonine protein kinase
MSANQPVEKVNTSVTKGLDLGDQLRVGMLLSGGWSITEKCDQSRCGRYSSGYLVKNKDGRKGFLKALNYDSYLYSSDPAEVLKAALDAYHDESRLLGIARARKLDRIVTLYDGATIRDESGRSMTSYLIFELAESDGRQQFESDKRAEYFQSISMIHDVAVGLYQLHRSEIAHQDIRAANVLCYTDARAKVADLGKAVDRQVVAEHINEAVPGDETYAAPELLYNSISPDWSVRRYGADLYLLGSLIVTFFMGTGMTAQLMVNLPSDLHYTRVDLDTYADVLPYLVNASAVVLQRLRKQLIQESGDPRWSDEIVDIVRQLCNPDPTKRGDMSQAKQGKSRFDLERYVGRIDRLTKMARVFRKKTP